MQRSSISLCFLHKHRTKVHVSSGTGNSEGSNTPWCHQEAAKKELPCQAASAEVKTPWISRLPSINCRIETEVFNAPSTQKQPPKRRCKIVPRTPDPPDSVSWDASEALIRSPAKTGQFHILSRLQNIQLQMLGCTWGTRIVLKFCTCDLWPHGGRSIMECAWHPRCNPR